MVRSLLRYASTSPCIQAACPGNRLRVPIAAVVCHYPKLSTAAHCCTKQTSIGAREEARATLLDAISQKQGDEKIEAALRNLAKYNPTPAPARSPALPGRWKLLWASKNAEV